jgi:hypothetical protein
MNRCGHRLSGVLMQLLRFVKSGDKKMSRPAIELVVQISRWIEHLLIRVSVRSIDLTQDSNEPCETGKGADQRARRASESRSKESVRSNASVGQLHNVRAMFRSQNTGQGPRGHTVTD